MKRGREPDSHGTRRCHRVKEGSLNGESDVDEVDEVDGGEEVVGMTENEPELASFTTVTWPGKTGPVTLHKTKDSNILISR